MSTVYLLKNQHNAYLEKSGEWVDGANSKSLYRTEFKDEAINQKVEFSVKNTELRIKIAEASFGQNGALEIKDYEPATLPFAESDEVEGENSNDAVDHVENLEVIETASDAHDTAEHIGTSAQTDAQQDENQSTLNFEVEDDATSANAQAV